MNGFKLISTQHAINLCSYNFQAVKCQTIELFVVIIRMGNGPLLHMATSMIYGESLLDLLVRDCLTFQLCCKWQKIHQHNKHTHCFQLITLVSVSSLKVELFFPINTNTVKMVTPLELLLPPRLLRLLPLPLLLLGI